MGLGQRLSAGLDWYRGWRMARSTGPLANFHRNGGNRLLVENLPVTSDELVFDVQLQEVDTVQRLVRELMEGALELDVPLVVDMNVGKNWLEAH